LDEIQETVEDMRNVYETLQPCVIADLDDKSSQIHILTVDNYGSIKAEFQIM